MELVGDSLIVHHHHYYRWRSPPTLCTKEEPDLTFRVVRRGRASGARYASQNPRHAAQGFGSQSRSDVPLRYAALRLVTTPIEQGREGRKEEGEKSGSAYTQISAKGPEKTFDRARRPEGTLNLYANPNPITPLP